MKEWIYAAANIGVPTLIILIVGYWFIYCFPDWQKMVNEGKRERAKIYADALKDVANQIHLQSEKIAVFGAQVEKFGELILQQGRLTERLIDMMDDHHNTIEDISQRCDSHVNYMKEISGRLRGIYAEKK